MANRKPPRPDQDVRDLAACWAASWTPAQGIEPWLKQQLDELARLIRVERWSWSDVALSLNQAGILYRSGADWTATSLGTKVATLRWEKRRRERGPASRQTFPIELLREALGKLGPITQLVVNIHGGAPGPLTATLGDGAISDVLRSYQRAGEALTVRARPVDARKAPHRGRTSLPSPCKRRKG